VSGKVRAEFGVTHSFTKPYRPQTERQGRTLYPVDPAHYNRHRPNSGIGGVRLVSRLSLSRNSLLMRPI
jgi:hypothetical protein